MISAFFATLIGGIKTTLVLAFIGAMVGICALGIGRLISGLTGYIAAAALGALVLVGAYGSTAFDGARARKAEQKIAQLEHEKARLARDLDVQRAASAEQDKIQEAQAAQIEADKAALAKLDEIIKSHGGDTSQCIFPDELDQIFDK
jgi:predicted lipid-binding transport protein (Tim44 family)